jgi:Leucine-rich repeat (LRR) protein
MLLSPDARKQIQAVREGRSNMLYATDLVEFPDEIRGLKGLASLFLRICTFRVIPDWIRELPNLKELDLRSDQFDQVPDIPGLMLDWNTYSRLQDRLSSRNLSGIWVKDDLEEAPTEIRHLSNLRELWIDSRVLLKVPEWLADLRHLTVIALYNNRFDDVPAILFRNAFAGAA